MPVNLHSFAFLLLLSTTVSHLSAQHIDIDKEALSFLASEENIAITFTYNDLLFNADDTPEEIYLKEAELKYKERQGAVEAANWLQNYTTSKNKMWPEMFLETLNERVATYENGPVFNRTDSNARYTMNVNTTWMYFGYDASIIKGPSKVSMDLTFFETATPSNIIFKTTIRRAMGKNNSSDHPDGWAHFKRAGKAYVKAAYKLSQALKRVVD